LSQAEGGIRDWSVTGFQTCALPIYDYLRVLYARLGQHYCPDCNIPVGTQTADEIIDKVLSLPDGTKLYLLAPVERHGQEKYDARSEERRVGKECRGRWSAWQ